MAKPATIVGTIVALVATGVALYLISVGLGESGAVYYGGITPGLPYIVLGVLALIVIVVLLLGGSARGGRGRWWAEIRGPRR